MIALWLALAGPAAATDDLEAWVRLYDGLLAEAADNDVDRAVRAYQDLARTLPANAPLRGVALYWQGRALDSDDDVRGAREALRECARSAWPRALCLDLLGRIELEQAAVREIPTRWTFDDVSHGFLHPWIYNQLGSIRVEDGVMVWRTTVRPDGEDRLVLGFAEPSPAPRGIRFRVRSSAVDATLRLLVFDRHGRRYVARAEAAVHRAPVGRWVVVDAPLRGLTDIDDGVGLDPAELDRVILQDESGRWGAPSAVNELLIDDFEIY